MRNDAPEKPEHGEGAEDAAPEFSIARSNACGTSTTPVRCACGLGIQATSSEIVVQVRIALVLGAIS